MEFPYESTFLRSALVNDPYSLGDVGPEDVLRIESQFPNLFNTSLDLTKVREIPKRVNHPPYLSIASKVTSHKDICFGSTCARPCTETNGNTRSSKSLKPSTPKISIPIIQYNPTTPDPMISVSKNDLKELLEKVILKSQMNHQHEKRISNPNYEFQKIRNDIKYISHLKSKTESKSIERKKILEKLKYQNPQFNSKIITDHAKRNKSSHSLPLNFVIGDEKDKAWRTFLTSQSSRGAGKHSKIQDVKNLKRAVSAPGFIRQPESTGIISRLKKPHSNISKTKDTKKVTFLAKQDPNRITVEKTTKGIIQVENKETKVDETGVRFSQDFLSDEEDSSLSLFDEKIQKSGNLIDLKGQEKFFYPRNDIDENGSNYFSVASSFRQMKLATNLANKYENIGLLKKKGNQDSLDDIMISFAPQKCIVPPLKTRTKHSQTQRQNKDISTEITVAHPPSNYFMENLARELVYAEVLKHLSGIQLKEAKESSECNLDNLVSDSNMELKSHFIAKQFTTQEVELPDDIDVSASTPQLTSSSSYRIPKKLSHIIPQETSIELLTPDLTVSTLKSIRPCNSIHRVLNNNDNTDCSEISDFLFSETEPKKLEDSQTVSKSFLTDSKNIIKTPSLSDSTSSKGVNHHHSKMSKSIWSKNDGISIVTPQKSLQSMSPSFHEKSTKIKAHQSLKEKLEISSISESQSIVGIIKQMSKVKTTINDSLSEIQIIPDYLQSELVSEGEFLGNGIFQNAYKSPGEISLSKCISEEAVAYSNDSPGSLQYFESDTNSPTFTPQKVLFQELSTGEYL